MERLQRLFGAAAAGHQPGMDTPTVDNAEMVYISSLALLKVGNQISCHKNFWFLRGYYWVRKYYSSR